MVRQGRIIGAREAIQLRETNPGSQRELAQAKKKAASGRQPEQEGFDKKLDGPNRPST